MAQEYAGPGRGFRTGPAAATLPALHATRAASARAPPRGWPAPRPGPYLPAVNADAPTPEPRPRGADDPAGPLGRIAIVLHRPQDLVNVALVVRAMKNMGLRRLRLVEPEEFDEHRIDGIAHGTSDLVERIEFFPSLEEAVADAVRVVGTTARRRTSPQEWRTPEEAAPELVRRVVEAGGGEGTAVAVVFGPEDRGLANRQLDLCHELLCIPTNPEHPSLNLAHAALLVFYELRRAADRQVGLPSRDLSAGKDETAPPATAGEVETFFGVWEEALTRIGFFHHVDPEPKMRTFRTLFQRARLDRRELQLLEAAAWEIVHYERRLRIRLEEAVRREGGGS
ncbi:MAG TPA: RNA methyltransferase, partial [Gemmatimonadota bacterium]|nr:RNA methyltransferase [Gemmatimonadota bacterium]